MALLHTRRTTAGRREGLPEPPTEPSAPKNDPASRFFAEKRGFSRSCKYPHGEWDAPGHSLAPSGRPSKTLLDLHGLPFPALPQLRLPAKR